ncbi:MAG: alpha/beta fold hydrolase [Gammaproteobacteria bacterium]
MGAPRCLPRLFSSRLICEGVAQFFALQGYTCWILEWRQHGHSGRPRARFTLETVAEMDVPVALGHVDSHSRGNPIYWIGHSGGGLLICMYLARHPEQQKKLRGLVFAASQAWAAADTLYRKLRLRMLRTVTDILGGVSGPWTGLGPESETAHMMSLWYGWNIRQDFVGADGFDYLECLPGITLPTLSLAGKADWLIAPPQGCEAFLNRLGGVDKTFVECSRAKGFSEDFTHDRVILSQGAAREIWPLIEDWIGQREG